MAVITLAQAQTIVSAGLAFCREKKFNPMAILVLDARGVPKAYGAEDGTALRRYDIAHGKAYGALAMGVGSKTLGVRAVERPHFLAAVNGAIGGAMVLWVGTAWPGGETDVSSSRGPRQTASTRPWAARCSVV